MSNLVALLLVFTLHLPVVISDRQDYGGIVAMYCTPAQAAGAAWEGKPGTRIEFTWHYRDSNDVHVFIEQRVTIEEHGQAAVYRYDGAGRDLVSIFWSAPLPVNLIRAECIDL